MNYKALGDTIIIKTPAVQSTSVRPDSGLVVIDSSNQSKTVIRAEVVSVGEGKFDEKNGVYVPVGVKIGDTIVTSPSVGVSLGDNYRMIKSDDIFAVVE